MGRRYSNYRDFAHSIFWMNCCGKESGQRCQPPSTTAFALQPPTPKRSLLKFTVVLGGDKHRRFSAVYRDNLAARLIGLLNQSTQPVRGFLELPAHFATIKLV